ncbi:UNVERIFIED_CONTAM: GDSL esterase/lipase [Sesamum radiatum]|uniref:GDSL esterase/lipase n=1 Tax=Sesamum radiatum TaxID=300843 RepID=A0AAW2T364_SESRA
MASVFHKLVLRVLVLCCLFSCVPQCANAHPLKICKFDQIYQLGDSISDTGNLIQEVPIGAATAFARLPYGETFFKNATGRCSNGLLMIDYIAMAAGLPFLPPYKNLDAADFEHGVNFAVTGSTALPSKVLADQHIYSPVTTSSLNVQLDWMFNYFTSICRNSRAYDNNQCLKHLNDFAKYHNEELKEAIHTLKQEKPNAVIVYGDYYNAYQFLLRVATSQGFERERACCGTGGKYNFNMTRMCGGEGVEVCSDPERHMSWDGVHLTQQGYKIMAAWLVKNIFPHLLCHF